MKLSNSSAEKEKKEIVRVIEKYEFIHLVTEWSMGKIDPNTFKYFELK